MTGELVEVGPRPRLVASFGPPRAAEEFAAWREAHADTLAGVPHEAFRVEYLGAGTLLTVRVRIDEAHLPPTLAPPLPPAA